MIEGKKCPHMFHKECLTEWLQLHDKCPCCRLDMMTPNEYREAAINALGTDRVTQATFYRNPGEQIIPVMLRIFNIDCNILM